MGVPLLLGLYLGDIEAGKLASIGALVILYIQSDNLVNRLMTLMVCGFGFILSYAIGAVFSTGLWIPSIVLALYTFGLHYSLYKLNLTKPPGNFFFIMVIAIAISSPKDLAAISYGTGNLALGVIIACIIALFYSLWTLKGVKEPKGGDCL